MRFCRNCGKELGGEDAVCPQCGSDSSSAPVRPRRRRKTPFYVIAAILVLAAVAVAVPFILDQEEPHSYEMTFTVDWYAVVDASGTVDNDYDSDAEVYFLVRYGGNEQLILFDADYPSGDYSVTSVPVHSNVSAAMTNKTYPSEGNTAIFNIPEGETVVRITIFMYDYDGPDKFSTASPDDVLDIYNASSPGSSSSQGIIISIPAGVNETDEFRGDMDPRGLLGYTVSFKEI